MEKWIKRAAALTAGLAGLQAEDAAAQSNSVAQTLASKLGEQCWSCDIYKKLAESADTILSQTFSFFVGGSSGFLGFSCTILAIVLIWRVIKMFGLGFIPGDAHLLREWDSIFRFAARSAVIFILFLGSSGASMMSQSSNSQMLNPFRDLFVDGPLAAGTQIGCMFIQQASQSQDSGVGNIQCSAGSGQGFSSGHVEAATQILKAFHGMGVGGLALAVQTMTYGATMDNGDMGSRVLIGIVGFVLAMMFLMFTISFGLRYIDALLKALVSLSLAPIFLVLWVFDSTRQIAHAALRSVLFMGALFATSGIVFVMAAAVMAFGYKEGLQTSGLSAAEIAGKAVIHVDPGGAANINWYSIAMLIGCWGMAIGLAGAAFRVAEELVAFNGGQHQGETGAGQEAASKVSGAMSSGIDTGMGMATGTLR